MLSLKKPLNPINPLAEGTGGSPLAKGRLQALLGLCTDSRADALGLQGLRSIGLRV